MPNWEYTSVNVGPGESWYDQLRSWGANGWEAWHIEKNDSGWREIYFKRHSATKDEHRAHKVMTAEEYAAMPLQGWHEVCRDVDGFGGVGVRFLGQGVLK